MLFNKIDLPISDDRHTELKGAARTAEYIVEKDSGDKRIVTVIASDESVDRDGDIIRQKGWKGLKEWGKAGAVLWAHNYGMQAVGVPHKAWVEKESKRLMAEMSFPEEYGRAYPASEAVYRGIEVGAIPCVSVGFSPTETRNPDDEERMELGLGQYGVVFEKQELFEISPCNVASNRNALVQQVKAAGIDTRSLEEMLQHEDNFVIELSSEPESGDSIIATDFDTMKLTLEAEGYTVTEKQEEELLAETLTVGVVKPTTVALDHEPEPASPDEETIKQAALEVRDAFAEIIVDRIVGKAKVATKRAIDYNEGRVVEE